MYSIVFIKYIHKYTCFNQDLNSRLLATGRINFTTQPTALYRLMTNVQPTAPCRPDRTLYYPIKLINILHSRWCQSYIIKLMHIYIYKEDRFIVWNQFIIIYLCTWIIWTHISHITVQYLTTWLIIFDIVWIW